MFERAEAFALERCLIANAALSQELSELWILTEARVPLSVIWGMSVDRTPLVAYWGANSSKPGFFSKLLELNKLRCGRDNTDWRARAQILISAVLLSHMRLWRLLAPIEQCVSLVRRESGELLMMIKTQNLSATRGFKGLSNPSRVHARLTRRAFPILGLD